MKVIYALQSLGKSVFLAGPTPRSDSVPSWRPEAIQMFKNYNFDGTLLVPETSDGEWRHEYDNQVQWEWEALNQATVILFWIPRDLETMPAYTTNVEFGNWVTAASSKVVYGRPDDAPKMKYLDAMANRYNIPIHKTLKDTVLEAISLT